MTKKGESGSSGRKRLYELVEERRPRSRRGIDSIDDVLIMEERDLAQEHKRLRLEALIDKRRRDNEKMRNGIVDGGPMASNADFMKMARLMSDLSPEEQQRVASAYAVLKMADKGQIGGSLQLLGPLLGYAKQNPGASEAQMVQYLTLMNSQFSKGLEIAKASNPKQDGSVELLKIFSELVKDSVKKPMEDLAKNVQPQQGILEQMMHNPQLRTTMKEIGMFGGSNAATTHLDLEIEKLRGERQLTVTKLELEMRRDELKRQAEDRRTDSLIGIFGPLASAFAGGAVAGKMRDLGQHQAAAHNPTNPRLTPMIPPGDYVQLQCPCGYRGTEPLADPPQTSIICPRCNQVLTLEIPPTEEKTVGTSVIHSTEEKLDERLV